VVFYSNLRLYAGTLVIKMQQSPVTITDPDACGGISSL
jgi:hypothetical protein